MKKNILILLILAIDYAYGIKINGINESDLM